MLSGAQFAGKIAWMRAELRDLKTAHQRGLGLIDFFKESTTFQAEPLKIYDLTITISETYRDVFPPLFQVAIDKVGDNGEAPLTNFTIDENNLQIKAGIGTMWTSSEQITIEVVSSAKIASVSVEEHNA